MASLVAIRDTVIRMGGFELKVPDFKIQPGVCHVSGANGTGKTTLIKLISGLIRPDSSTITSAVQLDEIGYIPQNYRVTLMPWLTARSNVQILDGDPKRENDLLELGLGHTDLEKKPSALSGGQCQRIAICRELVDNHKLLLCDEPFSSLDVQTIEKVGNLISRFLSNYRSALIISHQPLPQALSQKISSRYIIRRDTETSSLVTEDVL